MAFKPFDILAIVIIITLISVFALNTISDSNNNTFVKVEVEQDKYIYSLNDDKNFIIEGPIGGTTVQIIDSSVSILDSPCKNKTCIHMGIIKRHSQSIACLPNKIIITIEGEDDEIDGLSF